MKNDQKGTIVIISFIAVIILLILGFYFLNSVIAETRISKSMETAAVAYYLAESGINEAIWKLNNDSDWYENFVSETLNPDVSGEYWSDYFSRESIGGGSYFVTIENINRGYGEIISMAEVPFFDKKARRKIKISVFRGLDSPVYNAGIFTGGSSQNVSISHSKITINNGNLFAGNNLEISGLSIVRVVDDPETETLEGQIISSKEIKIKEESVVEFETLCSSVDCYDGCESCPPEDMAVPLIDFDSESPTSFKERAKTRESENNCSVYCHPENGEEYQCSNKCFFSGKEFENLLSEAGEKGILILKNEITYVSGSVNIEDDVMLDVNGVLVVDGDVIIGTKKIKSGDIGCHIKITEPGPNKASGLLSTGKIDFGESSLRENTSIEGVLYAYNEMSLISVPYKIEVEGALIARKFSITSVFEGIEITLNNEKIMRALGYLIDDQVITPIFSPIIKVDHWEEVY